MAEQKSLGKFFLQCVLLLLSGLVLVSIILLFRGRLFKIEVLILMSILLLSLIGFFGCRKVWGERVLFFVFLINLANVVFIWYFTRKLFLVYLFISLFGFLVSLPKRRSCSCCQLPKTEVIEEKPVSEEAQVEIVEEEKETGKKVKTSYSPGKFVASKNSNVYHVPTCDWAKKISPARRVWFKDKREAGRKKYKKHSCVE